MVATRVIIVEDEPLFRQLIHTQLSADPDIEIVGEADNGEDAVELAKALEPEVVLMDIEMGEGMTGIEAGYAIKAQKPTTGIVLLSNHAAKQFVVNSGGWSYLIKRNVRDIGTVARAVKGAAWGMLVIDPQLTGELQPRNNTALAKLEPEQLKVLELMAQGYTNKAITEELVIAKEQVEQYISQLYSILGVASDGKVEPRVAAVKIYMEQTSGGL